MLALVLTACGGPAESGPINPPEIQLDAGATTTTADTKVMRSNHAKQIRDLPGFFDCVRKEKAMVIAAHRGGPAPGYPENALETMQRSLEKVTPVLEIDVAESRDGVLFLMHDRSLRRTTGYDGQVANTDWSTISGLNLRDNNRKKTDFHPPKLTDVLIWAKNNGAILELDKKETSSFRNIVSAVRAAGAENNVILITYNDNQAGEVARLAPDLMLTASARGGRDIGKLEDMGIDPKNLIAWTGVNRPDAAAWDRNARNGVESAFGTLGRPGERLDDEYLADGDISEYEDMMLDGLVLLATDEAETVARLMIGDDKAWDRCGG